MVSQARKLIVSVAATLLWTCALSHPGMAQTDGAESTTEESTPAAADKAAGISDLVVTPTRVVFSGRERSAEVLLKNRGSKPTTYRISFMDLGVNEKGDYVEIDHYDKSAKDFIRYSPKQVALEPGASQKVKLLLRKPSSLADGEYRTHMKFQALPDPDFGENVEATAVTDQVSVKLIPLVGVSIPVIVQKGALTGDASLQASRNGKQATVTVKRKGTRSLLGDIRIKKGDAVLSNVAASLLMPATSRTFTIELPADSEGPLTAEYVETQGDTASPIASVTF